MKPCILMLTCKDDKEADTVSKALLEKKLIVCCKKVSITSGFLWKGKIDSADEVLLMMESDEDLFSVIEKEVEKLHSYDTFVLTSSPITMISEKAGKWFDKSLAR